MKILIASNEPSKLHEIEQLLHECAGDKLQCEGLVRPEEVVKTIERNQPEVVWVDLTNRPIRALSVIATCRQRFPSISLLASGDDHDHLLMRTAYRLGVVDFMETATWKSDLPETVGRIDADRIEKKKQLERKTTLSKPGSTSSSVAVVEALSVLIVTDDKTKGEEISALVQTQSRLKSSGVVDCRKAMERLRLLKPKIVWIDVSSDSKLELLREIRKSYPDCKLIASSETPDFALLNECFRAGVADFLDTQRWKSDLPAALQSMFPRPERKSSPLLWVIAAIALLVAVLGLVFH
jgi:DNA-binding NarL/FixJ family response regulator